MAEKYLVSACLAGENCKYNGKNNLNEKLMHSLENEDVIFVCPELLGGLKAPRPTVEIQNGDGNDVLLGRAKAFNSEGEDVTEAFVKGAQVVLEIAKENGISNAIFQPRSPSCGSGEIYDGTFSGKKRAGDGVATALLKRNGIEFMTMPKASI